MNLIRMSVALILLAVAPARGDDSPEGKALAYLATEVPS